MKIYALLALVGFGFLTALIGRSSAASTTWGSIASKDVLLFKQDVDAKSSFLRVISRDVVFPSGGLINNRTITGIKAIDRMKKHGGQASLLRGGPGQCTAVVHLKSERGEKLSFTVEVYVR